MCKALVEYRAGGGHYAAALELVHQAHGSIVDPHGEWANDMLTAMTLRRLGRIDEAREAFDRAQKVAADRFSSPEQADLAANNFHDWCVNQVLLREARELFGPAPTSR